jgi:hypothetical protein
MKLSSIKLINVNALPKIVVEVPKEILTSLDAKPGDVFRHDTTIRGGYRYDEYTKQISDVAQSLKDFIVDKDGRLFVKALTRPYHIAYDIQTVPHKSGSYSFFKIKVRYHCLPNQKLKTAITNYAQVLFEKYGIGALCPPLDISNVNLPLSSIEQYYVDHYEKTGRRPTARMRQKFMDDYIKTEIKKCENEFTQAQKERLSQI